MPTSLTPRQQEVLRFIEDRLTRVGIAPTVAEISRALGVRGPTAHQHLRALERKGYITRVPGRARGMRVAGFDADEPSGPACRQLPVVGQVAAGAPLLAVENLEGTVVVDASRFHGERLFALRVQGDSMIEAGILDKDLVIVRSQPAADPGDIVVALVRDEEATVKRFARDGDVVRLLPANKRYAPIVCNADEVQIRGKVLGIQRVFAE